MVDIAEPSGAEGVPGAGTGSSTLVSELEQRLAPPERKLNQAWWDAAVDATDATEAARTTAEETYLEVLADPALLEAVEQALAVGAADETTRRALEIARDLLLEGRLAPETRSELARLQARAESTFARTRGRVDGREVDDGEIERVLEHSDSTAERRAHWEASKHVGSAVVDDVLRLVGLRNQVAAEQGFRDWYALSLARTELDEGWLLALLDEVEAATSSGFHAYKAALDDRLAARFGILPEDLAPWHYGDPFFSHAVRNGDAEGDGGTGAPALPEGADLVGIATATYDGMGLETREVLARSDLLPRPGKNQHAFCISIDRLRDIRVLANVRGGERDLETLLHELGHAVYDEHVDLGLPWLLRRPAHSFVTEAVALLLGRLRLDPELLRQVLQLDAGAARRVTAPAAAELRDELLVFARWAMVMIRFERALYADPTADLAATWWELVEQLQGIARPEGRDAPDWASKIHLAVSPVYYQNYLLGELAASQIGAAVRAAAGGFIGRQDAGAFLAERVFLPGARLRWSDLIKQATGAPLGAGAFAADLQA